MRLDGEQIVIETTLEGRVVADASAVGLGSSEDSYYGVLDECDLPQTISRESTIKVISGLKQIAVQGVTVIDYLNSSTARNYLATLGIETQRLVRYKSR